MKLLSILTFVMIFVIALVFSVLNFHSVDINLFFFSLSMPLALALTIELFAGIAIGFVVAFWQATRLKKQYGQLRKSK
ncbi:MAG: LapA family protein [Methylococcales bacterium]|nr:LapA family protein [Methylococcales bacterium]